MRITNFGVNNFRGINGGLESNTVTFDNSNIIFLFGQNNVGKSTFLYAYDFFYNNTKAIPDDFYKRSHTNSIEFLLEVEFDDSDLARIEIIAPKKIDSIKKYLGDNNLLKVKRIIGATDNNGVPKAENAKNYSWNPKEESWEEKSYGSLGLSNIFQNLLPTPIFIKAMPTEKELEDIINDILKKKAENELKAEELEVLREAKEAIASLQEKMYNPEAIKSYKKEVNDHFQKVFPNTKIDFEDIDSVKYTSDKLGKKFKIHFEKIDDMGAVDESIPSSYENIGHGAVRTAIFALLLMQDVAAEYKREAGRKDFLVLFEEPELFLHPKLMNELKELIYKVSTEDYPYQLLCASHSPKMIDISKPKSSLVRMVQDRTDNTRLFQINEEYLKDASNAESVEELKQELYEMLRFNPHICESFYCDEVILVEGPTEEIITRGYFEQKGLESNIFVVNCGTVNNIPFYQKVFSKFSIKYNVICDTDNSNSRGLDEHGLTIFDNNIQGSIYSQFYDDAEKEDYEIGLFRLHDNTFEPAHQSEEIDEDLRMSESTNNGKPFDANLYWKEKLSPLMNDQRINSVPIIRYLNEIFNN